MKDANGFSVDIAQNAALKKDVTGIRINVDDFDEAYNLFLSKGFKNYADEGIINTASSKFVLMTAPSGFLINLCQHIKE